MRRPGPWTAAIATPHHAATLAGRDLLLRGGNAVDAAVGALLASCVAAPGAVGLGGYGGSMVAYLAKEGNAVAVDFDSRAPLAYRPEIFDSAAKYDTGYLSVTVPAVVAGLELARARFGTLPWATISEPALALAERGIPVTAKLRQQLESWATKADPVSRRALLPGGAVPEVGMEWIQRDLAELLRRLAAEGPGAFYHGDIPRQIVRQVQDHGGILAEEDFARYRAEVVEPLEIDYRSYRVLTPPPPSGGLTSLQILNMLEPFPLVHLQPWGAEYFHIFAEATKLAWQERAKYLGDPDLLPIPADRLLSKETAKAQAARIRSGGVVRADRSYRRPTPPHTVNILTADTEGNVVSLTATHGYLYGSAVVIDGLGLVLGHGMSRFDLAAGSPNAPTAGKRMAHNMAPTVLVGPAGRPFAAVGLPGGTKIVTVTAQLVVSLVDFQATPAVAVNAGRLHVETDEPVAVSAAVADAVVEELQALGHTVQRGQGVGGPPDEIGGMANALVIDPDTGEVSAASQAGEKAALTIDLGGSGVRMD